MIPLLVAVLVVALIAFGVIAYAGRHRRQPDDIDSFRRQIDALSPEARRQTADRMKPAEGRSTDDDGVDGT